MKEKIFITILAAVVGGVVGAGGVFYLQKNDQPQTVASFDELTVKKIKISDTLMLWPEGKDDADLIMTQGGILARTRLIATQICGNLIMGNAVFTTPDNPQNQVDQCRIYTEMGSNPNTGGAFVVRSPRGGHVLSQGVAPSGYSYNVGFDENDTLWGYSLDNSTKERALMVLAKAGPPQQPAPAASDNTSAEGGIAPLESTEHVSAEQNPHVVAQPGTPSPQPR